MGVLVQGRLAQGRLAQGRPCSGSETWALAPGSLKWIMLDDVPVGQLMDGSYFKGWVETGRHKIASHSEFGDNEVFSMRKEDETIFFEQKLKIGTFIPAANFNQVSEAVGKREVLKCRLATSQH